MKNFTNLILAFTMSVSIVACSAAEPHSQTADAYPSQVTSYTLSDARLDDNLPRVGDLDLTSGSLQIDDKNQTMRATLVFDLFPRFYDVDIYVTYTDRCGSTHYLGENTDPIGNDLYHSIHFIDHTYNQCADGPTGTLYAALTTTLHDGTETTSQLYWRPV